MADDFESIEHEIEIVLDAKGRPPIALDCPLCGAPMRRKPGNRYHCSGCDSDTTLELPEKK